MTRVVRGYCRICAPTRGLLVSIDGVDVVSIRGDLDHPVSDG